MRIQIIYEGNTYEGPWGACATFEEEVEFLQQHLNGLEAVRLVADDGSNYFFHGEALRRSVIRLIP